MRLFAAQRDQDGRADRDGVGAERQGLGDVRARPDAPGHDQLHLVLLSDLPQRLRGQTHRGKRGDSRMLDEDVLRRGRAALHPVHHDHVRAGGDGELDVVVRARRPDLHVDRDLPACGFAQLLDLDTQIVGPGPIGMPARRSLVDAGGERPHLRDAVTHLLAQQHAAAARLRALPDHHLDRVGLLEVGGVEPVA